MGNKVVIAIALVADVMRPAFERLVGAGCELVLNPHGRTLSEDELIELLPGPCATIAAVEPYTERAFVVAPELKVVARLGVGHDTIDLAAATRHGVVITMDFGTNHEAVADHALALMSGLANRLFAYHREVMERRWGSHMHGSLWGKTLGCGFRRSRPGDPI